MTRYFLELSYDGTDFCGWQIQPHSPSIQETINKALSLILQQEIYVVGCGRTDTGVHASHFIAHFDARLCRAKKMKSDESKSTYNVCRSLINRKKWCV